MRSLQGGHTQNEEGGVKSTLLEKKKALEQDELPCQKARRKKGGKQEVTKRENERASEKMRTTRERVS